MDRSKHFIFLVMPLLILIWGNWGCEIDDEVRFILNYDGPATLSFTKVGEGSPTEIPLSGETEIYFVNIKEETNPGFHQEIDNTLIYINSFQDDELEIYPGASNESAFAGASAALPSATDPQKQDAADTFLDRYRDDIIDAGKLKIGITGGEEHSLANAPVVVSGNLTQAFGRTTGQPANEVTMVQIQQAADGKFTFKSKENNEKLYAIINSAEGGAGPVGEGDKGVVPGSGPGGTSTGTGPQDGSESKTGCSFVAHTPTSLNNLGVWLGYALIPILIFVRRIRFGVGS